MEQMMANRSKWGCQWNGCIDHLVWGLWSFWAIIYVQFEAQPPAWHLETWCKLTCLFAPVSTFIVLWSWTCFKGSLILRYTHLQERVVLEGVNFGESPPPHRANVGKKIIFQALSWGLSSRKANHWMKQVIPHRQVYQRKRVPPSVPNLFGHSSLFEVNNFIVPWYSQPSHRPSWEWLWCRSPVLRWTPFHRIHTDHIPNPKCWLCHVISSWQYAWYI